MAGALSVSGRSALKSTPPPGVARTEESEPDQQEGAGFRRLCHVLRDAERGKTARRRPDGVRNGVSLENGQQLDTPIIMDVIDNEVVFFLLGHVRVVVGKQQSDFLPGRNQVVVEADIPCLHDVTHIQAQETR